jgi:hypothetical protein
MRWDLKKNKNGGGGSSLFIFYLRSSTVFILLSWVHPPRMGTIVMCAGTSTICITLAWDGEHY